MGSETGEQVGAALDAATVLILFVEVVIISIYLISLALVVVRRAKKLFELHNRKYYLAVVFYIASKLVLCAILVLRIIIGIPEEWKNLEGRFVEIIVKTAITLADFSIIVLFLVALEIYFALYFSIFTDPASKVTHPQPRNSPRCFPASLKQSRCSSCWFSSSRSSYTMSIRSASK